MITKITVPLIGVVVYSLAMVGISAGVVIAVYEASGDDTGPASTPAAGNATNTPSAGEMTEQQAVLNAQQYMYNYAAENPNSDEHAALAEGFAPACQTQELIEEGWLVQCGLRHTDGREFERLFDLVVLPDGTVSANAGGS